MVHYVLIPENVFISILCHSYGEVKDEGFYNPTNVTPFKFFSRVFYNTFKISEKSKLKLSHQYTQHKHSVTYEEIVDLLSRFNFTKVEIEMFLSKYKIREFSLTSREDVERIVKDIESRSFVPYSPSDGNEVVDTADERPEEPGEEKPPEEKESQKETTFIDYETLQARLDQIEIQFELMAERLNVICKRTLS